MQVATTQSQPTTEPPVEVTLKTRIRHDRLFTLSTIAGQLNAIGSTKPRLTDSQRQDLDLAKAATERLARSLAAEPEQGRVA